MIKQFLGKYKIPLLLDFLLILFGFIYFSFFVNKGLVLSDEGYYVHYAERIMQGQFAYKDFLLQYSPGFFYLLGWLYTLFDAQILVGRYVSLFFCLSILGSLCILLYMYKIHDWKTHVLVGFTFIFLSYPLLHIPLVIWPCVLFTVLIQIIFIFWNRYKHYQLLFVLGILLAISLFFRQTIGGVLLLVINVIVFLSDNRTIKKKLQSIFIICFSWAIFTFAWIYLFFILPNNLDALMSMYSYNKHFVSSFPFSYPPLSFLFQPTGFFKLLPYYYPIVFALGIIVHVLKKQIDWEKLSFAIISLGGFAVTVYPASDLLHVYPFLGVVITASIIYSRKTKLQRVVTVFTFIFIFIGIYLTFFTRYFRYEGYFLQQTSPLPLPKTKGIYIDPNDPTTKYLTPIYNFITTRTTQKDYIFVYPFHPMFYFILDRQNPNGIVQYVLLTAPEPVYPESKVIKEIQQKKVAYILTAGEYRFNTKLSRFIQQQKIVYTAGPYTVFKLQ